MQNTDWQAETPAFNTGAAARCHARWANIAKPLHSLGLLEKTTEQIAGLTGDEYYKISKRAVLVLCADNGVVRQGVTQTGSEVTAIVARNIAAGDASVCHMAALAHADVIPVDMGMLQDLNLPALLRRRVASGTKDISTGPAMTHAQALFAIEQGIGLVRDMKAQGYTILLTGEMGIGNTTTSSAMASVLLGCSPSVVTGRGAGLSSEALANKIKVIERAIAINSPSPTDALDILAKLGGYDIAGLTGVFLGGGIYQMPILVDGLISSVAALVAQRLCPASKHAMLASHVSAEPAGKLLLDALGLAPLISAELCLGEGSGAVCALPLLDMAYAVYNSMSTFEDIAVQQYQPLV